MPLEQHELLQQKTGLFKNEDWWAVWLGFLIFLLGAGQIGGYDLLGWVAKYNVWTDIGKALVPNSGAYAFLGGTGSAVLTFLFLLAITTAGAVSMGYPAKRFAAGFAVLYWVTVFSNIIGNYAYLAATPDKAAAFHIPWSLGLGELGFVVALILGLIIGNFFPGITRFLLTAAKPEWYIKTGIVILGMAIGIKTVGALGLASTVIFRGMCAVSCAKSVVYIAIGIRSQLFGEIFLFFFGSSFGGFLFFVGSCFRQTWFALFFFVIAKVFK